MNRPDPMSIVELQLDGVTYFFYRMHFNRLFERKLTDRHLMVMCSFAVEGDKFLKARTLITDMIRHVMRNKAHVLFEFDDEWCWVDPQKLSNLVLDMTNPMVCQRIASMATVVLRANQVLNMTPADIVRAYLADPETSANMKWNACQI